MVVLFLGFFLLPSFSLQPYVSNPTYNTFYPLKAQNLLFPQKTYYKTVNGLEHYDFFPEYEVKYSEKGRYYDLTEIGI
ncbi:MAG: hypothetical protein U5L96_17255 [Owenweeksia sp.]|nr:hypothetical protein [Owenweeksia sp.]